MVDSGQPLLLYYSYRNKTPFKRDNMYVKPISHDNEAEIIKNIRAVITGNTQIIEPTMKTEIAVAAAIVIEAYAKRNDTRKDYDYYVSMVETFLQDYCNKNPWEFIWFIRLLTDNDVMIRYHDVPDFRQIVSTFGPLLRKARTIHR